MLPEHLLGRNRFCACQRLNKTLSKWAMRQQLRAASRTMPVRLGLQICIFVSLTMENHV